MTVADEPTTAAGRLRGINRELAEILCQEPAELLFGAEAASADELVICGLLGGKDVGKSTLINALARTTVSVRTPQVGEGTTTPKAYVHLGMQPVVTARLREIDKHVTVEVATHQVDSLRNVVLLDLPDFDSEFPEHPRIVRAVAPLLDRVLWVLTPRKISDRAWVEMFRDVIKDARNVFTVLNKVDELLADADPFVDSNGAGDKAPARRFWQARHEWVAESIESAGCPQTEDHRFLVSAAFSRRDRFVERIAELWNDPEWADYGDDKEAVVRVAELAAAELDRLRACILGPVTDTEAQAIKRANRARESRIVAERIRQHHDLGRVIEMLEEALSPEYHRQVFNEAIGAEYCEAVGDSLRARRRPNTELADELLDVRVRRWPLLRLAYWPFGWLSRILGRRLGSTSPDMRTSAPVSLDVEGLTLADRIERMRSRILADHATLDGRLGLADDFPSAKPLADRVADEVQSLGPKLERQLIESITERDRRPSFFGKAALWLVFLWFPFAQPVAEGVLELLAWQGAVDVAHGLYKLVAAFSAVSLLAGFAVVACVYIALLACMYARSLRAVTKACEEPGESSLFVVGVEEILIRRIVVPLAKPLQDHCERLTALGSRLDAFTTSTSDQ